MKPGDRITIITQNKVIVCEVESVRDRTEPKNHLDHNPQIHTEIKVRKAQEIARGKPY